MHPSLTSIPSFRDLLDILGFIGSNPYLFISSGTVMTTLLLGLGILGTVVSSSMRAQAQRPTRLDALLHASIPTFILILVYFGAATLALSVQIYVRFSAYLPYESQVQLRSGGGHLLIALVGIAIMSRAVRGRTQAQWLRAHILALCYWGLHITLSTPPWFSFAGQGETILALSLCGISLGLAASLILLVRLRQKQASRHML